jgi:hypothetical protein
VDVLTHSRTTNYMVPHPCLPVIAPNHIHLLNCAVIYQRELRPRTRHDEDIVHVIVGSPGLVRF